MGPCLLLATMFTSCSKDNDAGGPQGLAGECSYQVALDGTTTLPNAYGQDMVVLMEGSEAGDGEDYFGFQIVQSKGGDPVESISLTVFAQGDLDRDLPLGDYPVYSVVSSNFSSPIMNLWPLYQVGDLTTHEVAPGMVLTLLENSERRIRMKVSGTVIKMELIDGVPVETGEVPLEAEVSMGADLLIEEVVEGTPFLGGICECQDQ